MKNLTFWLRANAVFSSLSGLVLIFFHASLARIFVISDSRAFWMIGIALLFFAATVWFESQRLRPAFVRWIVVQDFLWVVGSLVLLVLQPFGISAVGNWLIAAVAAAVGFLGWRQWAALRG